MRFLILRDIRYGGTDALERVCRAALAATYSGGVAGVVLAGEVFTGVGEARRLEALAEAIIEILGEGAPVVTSNSSAARLAGGSNRLPGGYSADEVCRAAGPTDFSKAPFSYALVCAGSDGLVVEQRQLVSDAGDWADTHIHTEFAYCGTDVTAAGAVESGRRYGLAGLCLTEHAGQLYVEANDFWSANFIHKPELWRAGSRQRMDDYLALTAPLRADDVLVGFESEVDIDGKLILRDEDRGRADLLLGAVHWINADTDAMTEAQFATAFCRQTEQVLAAGVDVLVHPVRLFARKGMAIPDDVQQTVAKLLAETDTPGEINFHKNDTPAEFYSICLELGVKLSLGSDSHRIAQVGNLDSHVRLLHRLTGEEDIARYVWNPFTDREGGDD